jgi:hypothetical protein
VTADQPGPVSLAGQFPDGPYRVYAAGAAAGSVKTGSASP